MQVVYKYEIPADKEFTLEMPKGARILSAAACGSSIFLWALVDRSLFHDEVRKFLPAVVGQPIPDDLNLEFINILHPENFVSSIILFEIKSGGESPAGGG
jgi:hypothetical protein